MVEAEDGTACTEKVVLKVGRAETAGEKLLTIDENENNMTVVVTGSVFFACESTQLDFCGNLNKG